jgi:hypothetical protein
MNTEINNKMDMRIYTGSSRPVVQLRWQCGAAPCRGAIGLLPLCGLLHWQGKQSASTWMESGDGGIRSGARRGT